MKNKVNPAHLNRLRFLEPATLLLKNANNNDDCMNLKLSILFIHV